MLTLAWTHEWRSMTRSTASVVALVGFLVVGALAILLGERHVAQWERAVATAQEAQAASVETARRALARGERGPRDKPRVDLREAHWQDHYAASRIVRQPGPLAGISAGAVDSAPAAFHVHRRAKPIAAGGYRIENPELAAGAVDLVFVLTVLVPLLIGILGLGIGTREREAGLEPLIVIQAGSAREWILARTVVVTAIAALASALLCVAAGTLGGANATELARLVAFALLYAALWGGLLLVVNARARTVRTAAFGFGAIWTLVCVLVPAVTAEVALGRVESDLSVDTTVDAREQQWEAYDQRLDALLLELYALYPTLERRSAAEVGRLSRMTRNYIMGAVTAAQSARLHREYLDKQREAARLAEGAAWLSPTIALTLGAERLAGVGADAGAAYRAVLVQAVQARVDWVIHRAWAGRRLGASDFDALVASTRSSFEASPDRLTAPYFSLLFWLVAAWGVALASLRTTGARPSAGAPPS